MECNILRVSTASSHPDLNGNWGVIWKSGMIEFSSQISFWVRPIDTDKDITIAPICGNNKNLRCGLNSLKDRQLLHFDCPRVF